jgi:hypothetical protein
MDDEAKKKIYGKKRQTKKRMKNFKMFEDVR